MSKVQCNVEKCAVRMKVKITRCTALQRVAATELHTRAEHKVHLYCALTAHLISLYTPDILSRDECNVARSVSCCS